MEIQFTYKNHRGEVSVRHVIPDALEFIYQPDPAFHYSPGWFLSGFDMDKGSRRSFALSNIVFNIKDVATDPNMVITPAGFPTFKLRLGEQK